MGFAYTAIAAPYNVAPNLTEPEDWPGNLDFLPPEGWSGDWPYPGPPPPNYEPKMSLVAQVDPFRVVMYDSENPNPDESISFRNDSTALFNIDYVRCYEGGEPAMNLLPQYYVSFRAVEVSNLDELLENNGPKQVAPKYDYLPLTICRKEESGADTENPQYWLTSYNVRYDDPEGDWPHYIDVPYVGVEIDASHEFYYKLPKPSEFDRKNVRTLFLMCEVRQYVPFARSVDIEVFGVARERPEE